MKAKTCSADQHELLKELKPRCKELALLPNHFLYHMREIMAVTSKYTTFTNECTFNKSNRGCLILIQY